MKNTVVLTSAMAVLLVACGGEASDSVAIPGAPPGGDTRPPISVASTDTTSTAATDPVDVADSDPPSTEPTPASTDVPSTEVAATTTTTVAPATTAASTTLPPTTVAATTTTAAPTTTELVYTPEPAEGALRVGVEGPRSLKVQQDLIALGILPSTAADSKYGPGTASGVRRFQESKGLVVDGLAGPNTLAALAEAVAALTPPETTA